MAKICLVASEVIGPYKGGGIATSVYGIATEICHDHELTILYAGPFHGGRDYAYCQSFFASMNIRFVSVQEETEKVYSTKQNYTSYYCYQWLKEKNFDVILFHEYGGLGYYAALAKSQNIAFQNSTLATVMHGPSEWARTINQTTFSDNEFFAIDFMERRSTELMDVVTAPSQYIIDWARRHGWQLPHAFVLRNIVPGTEHIAEAPKSVKSRDEIIFFGRQEYRKGFFLLCDAVDLLNKNQSVPSSTKITILGRFSKNNEVHSGEYLSRRSAKWRFPVKIFYDADQEEAMNYIRQSNGVVVMPSVEENAPCVVIEAIAAGVPFITTNTGGTPELIQHEDRESVCCEFDRRALAERLTLALCGEVLPARPSYLYGEAVQAWKTLLKDASSASVVKSAKFSSSPTVTVVLVHFERPLLLEHALQSLFQQSYSNFDIVIVDDGSTSQDAIRYLQKLEEAEHPAPITVIRQQNSYLGAARNTGVAAAAGKYVMFMDDDNLALPHELETFVRAAEATSADIVTCVSQMFNVDRPRDETDVIDEYVPLGPCLLLAASENCFGDANSLVRKEFFEAVGGFETDYGLGYEDYAFFAKALLLGARIEVVPERLFWYRVNAGSMLQANLLDRSRNNQWRVTREILDHASAIDPNDQRRMLKQLTALRLDNIISNTANYVKSKWKEKGNNAADLMDLKEDAPEAIQIIAERFAVNGRIDTAASLLRQIREKRSLSKHTLNALLDGSQIPIADRILSFETERVRNPNFDGLLPTRAGDVEPYSHLCAHWFLPRDARDYNLKIECLEPAETFIGTQSGKFVLRFTQRQKVEGGFKGGQYLMLAQNLGDVVLGSTLFRVRFMHRSLQGTREIAGFLRIRSRSNPGEFTDYWFQGTSDSKWTTFEKFIDCGILTEPSEAILFISLSISVSYRLELADFSVVSGRIIDSKSAYSDIEQIISFKNAEQV